MIKCGNPDQSRWIWQATRATPYAKHGIFLATFEPCLSRCLCECLCIVYAFWFIFEPCWSRYFCIVYANVGSYIYMEHLFFSFLSQETLKSLWRIHFKTDLRGIGVSNWIGLSQSLRENQWKTTCLMEKHRKNHMFSISPPFFS